MSWAHRNMSVLFAWQLLSARIQRLHRGGIPGSPSRRVVVPSARAILAACPKPPRSRPQKAAKASRGGPGSTGQLGRQL